MPGRVANKQEWLETLSSAQGALAADETIIILELATQRQLCDSRASDSGGGGGSERRGRVDFLGALHMSCSRLVRRSQQSQSVSSSSPSRRPRGVAAAVVVVGCEQDLTCH